MQHKALNFEEKFGLFDERWMPKVIVVNSGGQDSASTAANDAWI